jgi:hypothetical protein
LFWSLLGPVDGWPMSRVAELLPANYAATVEAESRSPSGGAIAR